VVCVHRGKCSYVYEYLRLYCVSKKTTFGNILGITFLNTNVLSPNCDNKFYNVRIRNSGRN
jgi:hypothetical protein